ncbi:MAG: chemotaxis protein CheX [Desulfopila sp.]
MIPTHLNCPEVEARIIDSVQEIFSTMVKLTVVVSPSTGDEEYSLDDSISGIIGFTGLYKGVLAIHLPSPVAMTITGNLLGVDVAEINEEVEDAVGELANILGGSVKELFAANGRDIELSLPSTISGAHYDVLPAKEARRHRIHFTTAAGPFSVELQHEESTAIDIAVPAGAGERKTAVANEKRADL